MLWILPPRAGCRPRRLSLKAADRSSPRGDEREGIAAHGSGVRPRPLVGVPALVVGGPVGEHGVGEEECGRGGALGLLPERDEDERTARRVARELEEEDI